VKLITHLHLVLRSKNTWSYTSTPQYVFMVWCLVKHRYNFIHILLSTKYDGKVSVNEEQVRIQKEGSIGLF
jgi:hypothetical protein